jgi:WD40 repeat protein
VNSYVRVASRGFPFIGLRPFTYHDREFFFGREEERDVLQHQVMRNRFVAIVGGSGCGKSSLISAGLRSRLEYVSDPRWNWIEMRPADAPIEELARALAVLTGDTGDLSQAWADRFERVLTRSSFGIGEALASIPALRESEGSRVLLLVDQFEELFRFANLQSEGNLEAATAAARRDEATAFVRLLLTATKSLQRLHVVVTMRSDFLGDCARFHGLPQAVSGSQFLVPGMTRDQREDAIRKPIRLAGGQIDSDVVQLVLNSTNEEPDQLPILQHAMMRCWERAFYRHKQKVGPCPHITIDDYKAVGGVDQGLSVHANEILKALARQPDSTTIGLELATKRVFQALIETDQGVRSIRRPQRFRDLIQYVRTGDASESAAEKATRAVVGSFAKPDCSFLRIISPADIYDKYTNIGIDVNSIIDIGHEALIRCWDKLRGDWVREEQDDAEKYRLLVRLSRIGSLIREDELPAFENWWSTRKPTRAWARRYTLGAVDTFDDAIAVLDKSRTEIETRTREKEEAQKTKTKLAYAQRLVFWNKGWALGSSVITIFAVVLLWYLNTLIDQKNTLISQKNEVEKWANFNFDRYRLGQAVQRANEFYGFVGRPLNAYFASLRDLARVDTGLAKDATLLTLRKARENIDHAQKDLTAAETDQRKLLSGLEQFNEDLWSATSESDRAKIVANVKGTLASTADPQSKLRLAMYAVAAMPKNQDEGLIAILRDTVSNSPQVNLRLPGATQTWGVAFDPRDNHRAAVGADNGVVWLWDPLAYSLVPDQNIKLLALSAAESLVNSLAFNENGSLLAAAYRSHGVVVWELSNSEGKLACPLEPIGRTIGAYGVAFHGSVLAIGGGDNAVHLLDASTCQDKGKIFRRNDVVFGVAISGDGRMLAAASGDGSVVVWDIDNPEIKFLDEDIRKPMFAVAFSRDGKMLAATGADGIGYFWEIQHSLSGVNIKPLNIELSRNVPESLRSVLGQISFSKDEDKVVATARRYSTDKENVVADAQISLSKDKDEVLATAGRTALVTAVITDTRSLQENMLLRTGRSSLFGVAFSPDSKNLLVSSNETGAVSLFSVGSAAPIDTTDRGELLQLGFRRLITTDLSQNECKTLASTGIPIFEMSFKRDGCQLPLLAVQKFRLDIQLQR